MFSTLKGMFSKNNKNETNSVRSPDDITAFNSLIKSGPKTLVLIHADWCGPCQQYKPLWKELESTPGRVANMAMVHHDMVDNIDILKKASIPGYPSVLKVFPDGTIEQYKDTNKKATNNVPHMRDMGSMVRELKTLSPIERKSNVIKPVMNLNMKLATKNRNNLRKSRSNVTKRNKTASRTVLNSVQLKPLMKGGLYTALSSALMKAGPASFLFGVSQMLPPKKTRGSTKRLTRKSRSRR